MAIKISDVSTAQLKQIVQLKEQMEDLEAQLARIIGGAKPAAEVEKPGPKKRRLSAAGRAAIIAATKARWAKVKAAKAPAAAKPIKPVKKKRTMSAAAKAKLAAIAKKRWAKIHAQGKKRL